MDYNQLAEKSLQGEILTRGEMKAVLQTPDEKVPELLDAAFRVRHHFFGKRVQIHMLMNARAGSAQRIAITVLSRQFQLHPSTSILSHHAKSFWKEPSGPRPRGP